MAWPARRGLIDLTGRKLRGRCFGNWTVMEYVGNERWRLQCECGATRVALNHLLRKDKTKSCGVCRARADTRKAERKAGLRAAAALYRASDKYREKIKAQRAAWYIRNRDRLLPHFRDYHAKNKGKLAAYAALPTTKARAKAHARLYRLKHLSAVRIQQHRRQTVQRDRLATVYVRRLLVRAGFPERRISSDLIALKRNLILVQRAIRSSHASC